AFTLFAPLMFPPFFVPFAPPRPAAAVIVVVVLPDLLIAVAVTIAIMVAVLRHAKRAAGDGKCRQHCKNPESLHNCPPAKLPALCDIPRRPRPIPLWVLTMA